MIQKSNTIIFFGNERLATGVSTNAPTLRGLLQADYPIACVVVNNTDTRSRNKRPQEVVEIAKQYNIPVLAPARLRDVTDELKKYHATIGTLAAYGKIIPQSIIDIFPLGIINIHPSLLPLHRGPTPIESTILQGEHETGVSVMRLIKEMDAGPVYKQQKVSVSADITKQELANQLSSVGSTMLLQLLPDILERKLMPIDQVPGNATYDELINKQDGTIRWDKPAEQIEREIRAYAGWPKSKTTIGQLEVVITKVRVSQQKATHIPGAFTKDHGHLVAQCGENSLEIETLIPQGKKEMTGQAFLAGYGNLI